MNRRVPLPTCLVALVALTTGCQVDSLFRIRGDDPQRLEAEVFVLRDSRGREIVVPCMLHLGEESFFKDVAGQLSSCDLVVVEGIRGVPEAETRVGPGAAAPEENDSIANPAALDLLAQIAARLELETQHLIEERGWLPEGRVLNVDMTWTELRSALAETDETLRALPESLDGLDEEGMSADLLLGILLAGFTRETVALAATDYSDEPSEAIVLKRNRRVVDVVERALEAPEIRRVGVRDGGGHVPDLLRSFAALGFEVTQSNWVEVFGFTSDRKRTEAAIREFGETDLVRIRTPKWTLELEAALRP